MTEENKLQTNRGNRKFKDNLMSEITDKVIRWTAEDNGNWEIMKEVIAPGSDILSTIVSITSYLK